MMYKNASLRLTKNWWGLLSSVASLMEEHSYRVSLIIEGATEKVSQFIMS
jgi:hypothetical protein